MQREETRYLNTDLVLVAPRDLASLADALVRQGLLTLHVFQEESSGLCSARFETEEPYLEPDQNIAAILTVIETLDETSQEIWHACTLREFEIGYDCGDKPWAFNQ